MTKHRYWLMKSEPNEYSIEQLRSDQTTWWDGIRNYQAKAFLAEMHQGDLAFFYHSSCQPPGIAGIMEIVDRAEADPSALDKGSEGADMKAIQSGQNPWLRIKVRYHSTLPFIDRKILKTAPCFKDSPLLMQSRLSVMPITAQQWQWVLKRG